MPLDFEKYRHHVDNFDLTQAQQDEVMATVWRMMASSVDQAFGTHPVQQCRGKNKTNSLQSQSHGVDSKHPTVKEKFKQSSQADKE